VRQAAADGVEARAQATNRKTQDRVEAKAKVALLAACARPVHVVRSARKPVVRQPQEFTKSQLNAMLAEAIINTARLRR
jgi:GcrA cell cycle regulator